MPKVAVVTGASRGIGRAIAVALGKQDFLVVVHFGKSRSAAEEVVRQITVAGGSAFSVAADLSSLDAVFDFIQSPRR